MEPTLAGFLNWCYNFAEIPQAALPSNSPYAAFAFNMSHKAVNKALIPTGTYTIAVYNLAGSYLINNCPDQPGQTFFKDLRAALKLNTAFIPGVVASSGDQGTSVALLVPDFFKDLSLEALQRLKDPFGLAYLTIAQDYGPTVWGLTR